MFDAGDTRESPFALVAYTVYVCAVFASCVTTTDVELVVPVFPSEDAQVYRVIALPPFTGAVQVTVSWLTPAVAVGAAGVAGTVVTVTASDGSDATDVPAAFVAVTVNVGVADEAIPVTTKGEDAPVAVCPVLAVTVNDVAEGESSGKENDTETAPSLNARPVPTSVPTGLFGFNGSKKSFDAWDFLPAFLLPAICIS